MPASGSRSLLQHPQGNALLLAWDTHGENARSSVCLLQLGDVAWVNDRALGVRRYQYVSFGWRFLCHLVRVPGSWKLLPDGPALMISRPVPGMRLRLAVGRTLVPDAWSHSPVWLHAATGVVGGGSYIRTSLLSRVSRNNNEFRPDGYHGYQLAQGQRDRATPGDPWMATMATTNAASTRLDSIGTPPRRLQRIENHAGMPVNTQKREV